MSYATPAQIATVAKHFLIAAVWADADEGTRPRLPLGTQAKAREFCARFIRANGEQFEAAMRADGYGSHPDAGSPEASFGHDLWLTCRGHGVGFWDRAELKPYGALADELTSACRAVYLEGHQYRGWFYFDYSFKG